MPNTKTIYTSSLVLILFYVERFRKVFHVKHLKTLIKMNLIKHKGAFYDLDKLTLEQKKEMFPNMVFAELEQKKALFEQTEPKKTKKPKK